MSVPHICQPRLICRRASPNGSGESGGSPRSGLWRESVNNPDRLVDDFVETQLVVCRDIDLLSLALARLKRHKAGAAIVFHGAHRPRAADVVGVITKRAIADAVIDEYED